MYGRLLTLSLLVLLITGTLASACVVIPPPPPRPDIKPLYLQCKSQHVETTITDQVARTTVTTVLHNPHDRQIEGTFLYPLPPGASVSDFSYWIGDKEMKGELLDRDKARKIYEDIVRTMRDPALLEYEGGGLFKASIFPIPPGGDAQTKLQFTQVLKAEAGVVTYTHAVKLGRNQPNRGKLTIEANIKSQAPIKAVYSPTHKIEVVRKSDHSVSVGLELDDTDFGEDFELIYTLAEKDFGVNALTYREEGENGYFMLLLSPKQEWGEQEIVGKDVVFVVDTSGSMSGEKIEQTKKAFEFCLQSLKPKDRFGLLTFATSTRLFEDSLLEATPENVKRAREFVSKLEATGATALNEALEESLQLLEKKPERPSMVIFLTDGRPTSGESNTDRIIENVNKVNKQDDGRRGRLFIFGVGNDVNTHLLDRLAEENGGSSNYVRPEEDIEAAVSSLYAKLSHPVLSGVAVKVGNVRTYDVYPQKLPDLFVGTQIVLVGRYEGDGDSAITLTGNARGEDKTFTYETTFPKETTGNAFLARVWAVRRIGYLLDQIRLNGEDKELKDEVVKLAMRFGIVTPYTSYLVQEDEAVARRAPAAFSRPSAAGMPGAPGMAGGPAPAQPSAAMKQESGADAVHAARSIAQMKDTDRASASSLEYRNAGERTFYTDGEWWIDTTWAANGKILKIKAFSQAYFDLLKARPELKAALALGEKVRVRVDGLGLEVGPEGLEALTPPQLEEIKK